MVVWLFAGGGPSEIRGLIPMLKKMFPCGQFIRKTPVGRTPGKKPRPDKTPTKLGKTGNSLSREIEERLKNEFDNGRSCDIILIIDDLDCHDAKDRRKKLQKPVKLFQETKNLTSIVGFAAPEMEAWLIADWDKTFAKHPAFKGQIQKQIKEHLIHQHQVDFGSPEAFSHYDPEKKSCKEKLSESIGQVVMEVTYDLSSIPTRFSKAIHTPWMLKKLDAGMVSKKCPEFKKLYSKLQQAFNSGPLLA